MFRGAFPRIARGYGAAILVAGCVASASNEGHAATARIDLIAGSKRDIGVLASAVAAKRIDHSQAVIVPNDVVNIAYHESFSGLTSPPLVLRFSPASDAIKGIASTYDPRNADDANAGGQEMASGETYDPKGWNAAIRVDLRDKFGGVNFGKAYRLAYALVESDDKRVIVKVNDVGSLEPGRIIDLNIRTMRYFDSTLKLGLLHDVKVTPLIGTDMPLGPVKNDSLRNFAGWFS